MSRSARLRPDRRPSSTTATLSSAEVGSIEIPIYSWNIEPVEKALIPGKPFRRLGLLDDEKGGKTMKKSPISVFGIALLIGVGFAQNQAPPANGSEAQKTALRFAPGTIIRIELAKSIDAKKAKAGDEIAAKT